MNKEILLAFLKREIERNEYLEKVFSESRMYSEAQKYQDYISHAQLLIRMIEDESFCNEMLCALNCEYKKEQ